MDAPRIPIDQHMRNMVGNIGDIEGGADARNLGDFPRYEIKPPPPFFLQRLVVFLQIKLERFDHADDFLLPTFAQRPNVSSCGLLLSKAYATRSFRPTSNPAHCGPRIALPPLNAARS